ncbi:MAG: type I secretion system permease/ATPase [Hyphomicrobiaceae bacterium]
MTTQATPGEAAKPQGSRRPDHVVKAFFKDHWWVVTPVVIFSCIINILMLTGALFSLQVYDRVLSSRSVPTLAALFGLVVALFTLMAVLELIRSRVLTRLGQIMDRRMRDHLFEIEISAALAQPGKGRNAPVLRDLETLRQFFSGPGLIAFLDGPWIPIYLFVIFLLHKMLGIAGLIGALLLITLAVITEWTTVRPQSEASDAQADEARTLEGIARNAESVKALGMFTAIKAIWVAERDRVSTSGGRANDRSSGLAAFSRSLRQFLQSAMLGLGAYYVIQDELTGGMIIAVTTLYGRALQPIEQFISQWRNLQRARTAYATIGKAQVAAGAFAKRTRLTRLAGHVVVDDLRVVAPGTQRMILKRRGEGKGVSFELKPGQILGIIGPSGAGKSTLVRAIAGVLPQSSMLGRIEFDGVQVNKWDPHQLGQQLGYVPQEMQLFAGTVKQNISRFDPNTTDEAVVEAATLAGVQKIIADLPDGYETQIGHQGAQISMGQRQRIVLARALYGNPNLVILDEPNSNLDSIGDDALDQTLSLLKMQGKAVILTSHKPDALQRADFILLLARGEPMGFGPRREVLANLRFLYDQQAAGKK